MHSNNVPADVFIVPASAVRYRDDGSGRRGMIRQVLRSIGRGRPGHSRNGLATYHCRFATLQKHRPMKMNTKQKILQTGAEIIHRKGFNATGLQEILSAANVPKGSFYNHFKSKEDFGLQVIDYFSDFFSQFTRDIVEDTTRSPLARLEMLLDRFMEFFESTEYTCGCPVGNLAQEMGDISPAFQKKLADAIDSMVALYAGIISEAQAAGETSRDIDAKEAADFIVASWHGALIRMKVAESVDPLKNQKKFVLNHVLKP
jgi:TetR/AcrR family transcriptional repressor of nem operon